MHNADKVWLVEWNPEGSMLAVCTSKERAEQIRDDWNNQPGGAIEAWVTEYPANQPLIRRRQDGTYERL